MMSRGGGRAGRGMFGWGRRGPLPWIAGHEGPGFGRSRSRDAGSDDAAGDGDAEAGGEAAAVVVEFYGKPGCHLCDEARPVVERVVAAEGAQLVEHDILQDERLLEQYGELIPVVLVAGREHATWRVDERALTRAVRSAAARGATGGEYSI